MRREKIKRIRSANNEYQQVCVVTVYSVSGGAGGVWSRDTARPASGEPAPSSSVFFLPSRFCLSLPLALSSRCNSRTLQLSASGPCLPRLTTTTTTSSQYHSLSLSSLLLSPCSLLSSSDSFANDVRAKAFSPQYFLFLCATANMNKPN